MNMQKTGAVNGTLLLLATGLLLAGCSSNIQPYFAVSGTGSEPLYGVSGTVESLYGQPSSPGGEIIGSAKSQRLLTLIFLAPGAKGNSSGSSLSSGGPVASVKLSIGTSSNRADCAVEWDKKSDTLMIDGTKYDRSQGTLFVILKSPTSTRKVWQLTAPSTKAETNELVSYAKRELGREKSVQDALVGLRQF